MINKNLQYLVACDLDGTLLNSWRELSESTIKYLTKLRIQYPNVYFCLITGRNKQETKEIYQQLNLNTIAVCCNGGQFTTYNQAGFSDKTFGFNKTVVSKILTLPSVINNIEQVYIISSCDQNFLLEGIREVNNFLLHQFNQLVSEIIFLRVKFLSKKNANEIINDYKQICQNLKLQFWKYLDDNFFYLEIQSNYVNKALGVKFLTNYYNIPSQNTFCFGDNNNDVEMLSMSECQTFAMANGTDIAKIKAKKVTKKTNNQDGVIRVLQQYFPVD